ncbi:MAG: YtxH domain-containing protein [Nitrospirota bacterium]
MDEEKKKKRKLIDKVIMGAVIGGAIGSVLGATIAPKKGSETRKDIAQAADKAKKGGSRIFRIIKKWLLRKKNNPETDRKRIPHEHV